MTARILRIELRRSSARWLALVALFPLLFVGEADRGLTVLVMDTRQLPILISPILLGVAAWHARRDRRSGMDELVAATARPRWQRVLPAAAVGALGMVAPVSLGLAAGRWLPFRLVAPLLLVFMAVSLFVGDTEGYIDPPGWLLLWGNLQSAAVALWLLPDRYDDAYYVDPHASAPVLVAGQR